MRKVLETDPKLVCLILVCMKFFFETREGWKTDRVTHEKESVTTQNPY